MNDREIIAARPPKNAVDPRVPYAFLVEPERTAAGDVADIATIFLTNRECPFRCLFCDLWKNTTDSRVPVGAIPEQIDYALARLPSARQIKLYNSGNFFDVQAIPREDYAATARRVSGFERVIVENHPKLCNASCLEFRDLLGATQQLEIALGLETAHPEILSRLNKQMTVDDYRQAVHFLRSADIAVRTFILLQPPFMPAAESVQWAVRSLEIAFDAGADCCTVIPTRSGNGTMQQLEQNGLFTPPTLLALEQVLEAGLRQERGRVFVDLWDIEKLFACSQCGPRRAERLKTMNLSQRILPAVSCECEDHDD